MGLSKLINKVNKAKSAINSLKGISSKLQSLQYNSVFDQLGDEAKKAQEHLRNTRKRDDTLLAGNEQRLRIAATQPQANAEELMYPLHDALENYIVFTMKPRQKQKGKAMEKSHPLKSAESDVITLRGTQITNDKALFNDKTLFNDGNKEILLYIPADFTSTTSATYTKADFGLSQRQLDQFVENAKDKGVVDAVGEIGTGALLSQGFTSFLNGLQGGLKNVREGRAKNPMTESMFEGVSFREWNFEYEFWPKSSEEAEMVKYIIYTFRTAMLPDTFGEQMKVQVGTAKAKNEGQNLNADENYFNHPNIFKVSFEGPIANHLDGFLEMVCTKCDVSHFNNGNNTTFGNSAPISQKMSLSFQEIKMLTQESYQEISAMYNGKDSPLTSMKTIGEKRKSGTSIGTDG